METTELIPAGLKCEKCGGTNLKRHDSTAFYCADCDAGKVEAMSNFGKGFFAEAHSFNGKLDGWMESLPKYIPDPNYVPSPPRQFEPYLPEGGKNLGTFDGGYGRLGYVSIFGPAECDVCKQEKPAVIVIDGSEQEYGAGGICRDCAISAFDAFQPKE